MLCAGTQSNLLKNGGKKMDYNERKSKSAILEGLLIYHENQIKKTNNPYAAAEWEPDMKIIKEQVDAIYKHAKLMGVLK